MQLKIFMVDKMENIKDTKIYIKGHIEMNARKCFYGYQCHYYNYSYLNFIVHIC